MAKKTVIGIVEKVKIETKEGRKKIVKAKVDTGATKSSFDMSLASKLKVGPVIKSRLIKSAHGNRLRPIVTATIEIGGKKIKAQFTLADRRHLRYQVLIGINILKKGKFIVDPLKK